MMGSDRMLPRYVFYKPFTVKFPDKCEQQNGFNPARRGTWSGTQTDPRPIKALVLGCIDGVQAAGIALVLGTTAWYFRLKYMPLRPLSWRT
jgi:hypothetical protein